MQSLDDSRIRASMLERAALLRDMSGLRHHIGHLKEEATRKDRDLEHTQEVITTLRVRIAALEQAVDGKDSTLVGSSAERRRLQDEISELQTRLKVSGDQAAEAEHTISLIRADNARLQEEIVKQKHITNEKENQLMMVDVEKKTLVQDRSRLQTVVETKDKEIANANRELSQLREDLVQRKLAMDRVLHQSELDQKGLADANRQLDSSQSENRTLQTNIQRLSDLLIVKDNDIKELRMDMANTTSRYSTRELEFDRVVKQRDMLEIQLKQLQDQYTLRTHEVETMRKELEGANNTTTHCRNEIAELSSTEGKLRWQLEQMRKDLETEKNNTRLLQEQYTIFQFVVSSRGELVSSLWKLYQLITGCVKGVKDAHSVVEKMTASSASLNASAANISPNTSAVSASSAVSGGAPEKLAIRKEWRDGVVTKLVNAERMIKELEDKATYIIANYFSEYEKLHLGVSSYYFHPDSTRPPVVGDALLSKLREVTPAKQFVAMEGRAGTATPSKGVGTMVPTIGMTQPLSTSVGPKNAVSSVQSPPRSRSRPSSAML
eukprot:PhM_4_TR15885/c1_g1_i4/m.17047